MWRKYWLLILLFVYLLSRSVSLVKLPIFADEAIYIRWAQMIHDDPKQFMFLPLYDGKTPLYIWMLIPLVNNTIIDPLFAARMLSVVIGGFLLWGIGLLVKEMGGSKRAQLISVLLTMILPFTFFYSRMALIDILLTLWLAFSLWAFLVGRKKSYKTAWILLAGLFWGLALLTKTSAFYFLPSIAGIFGFDLMRNRRLRSVKTILIMIAALGIGFACIGWMRISPLFPFLFQRSSDFAFSFSEIWANLFQILLSNSYRIGKWLLIYFTPAAWLVVLSGLRFKTKHSPWVLVAGLFLFLLPFVVSGKVLSSRYFLPSVIWLIPLIAIYIDTWFRKNYHITLILVFLLVGFSGRFMWPLYADPGKTPFANEDVVQYLTEWSAGYGIPEVRDFLTTQARDHKIYVATEGYFGTLPDGLFIYFNHSPLQKNLEIHGIGQPVSRLPQSLLEMAKTTDTYLVVNQHRLINPTDSHLTLIAQYPRPLQGPPLLLLKVNP